MYDLWKIRQSPSGIEAQKVGDFRTVAQAKRAACRSGTGHYHICDASGAAIKVRVAGRCER